MSPSPDLLSAAAARPHVYPSFASRPRGEAAATPVSDRPRQPAAPTPEEIEAIVEGARAAGFEAGRREGRAQAHAEWEGRLEAGRHTIEEAARRLLAARGELAAEVERQWPRLLFALARKVLSQELGVSQTAAQTVIRGISERLAGCEHPVTVRLAPDAVAGVESWLHAEDGGPPRDRACASSPIRTSAPATSSWRPMTAFSTAASSPSSRRPGASSRSCPAYEPLARRGPDEHQIFRDRGHAPQWSRPRPSARQGRQGRRPGARGHRCDRARRGAVRDPLSARVALCRSSRLPRRPAAVDAARRPGRGGARRRGARPRPSRDGPRGAGPRGARHRRDGPTHR